MRPNMWYYTIDGGNSFHEKPEDMSALNRGYTQFARTDERGEWVVFKRHGKEFFYVSS